MGYGVVKPRLGAAYKQIVVGGVIYFVLAAIYGVYHNKDQSMVSGKIRVEYEDAPPPPPPLPPPPLITLAHRVTGDAVFAARVENCYDGGRTAVGARRLRAVVDLLRSSRDHEDSLASPEQNQALAVPPISNASCLLRHW
jgi:hypothetical protein